MLPCGDGRWAQCAVIPADRERRAAGVGAEEACQIQDALCNKYTDKAWLLSYRKWTPQLADSIANFLAIRVR